MEETEMWKEAFDIAIEQCSRAYAEAHQQTETPIEPMTVTVAVDGTIWAMVVCLTLMGVALGVVIGRMWGAISATN